MIVREIEAERLLEWSSEQGALDQVERKWAWFDRPDGTRSLLPVHGLRYLYRGQNRRHWSCGPTLLRGISTRTNELRFLPRRERYSLILNLIRAQWFCSVIEEHPVLSWALKERIHLDRMALAQHYGMRTGYLDLTEAFEIGAFFACCKLVDGRWEPCTAGQGVLYRLDWQETVPEIRGRARPIGLQPFARPRGQWAWTLEMMLHEDLEDMPGVEAVVFEQSERVGVELLRLLTDGQQLYPKDPLATWARRIEACAVLPRTIAEEVATDLAEDPLGAPGARTESLISELEVTVSAAVSERPADIVKQSELLELEADWHRVKFSFEEEAKENTQFYLQRVDGES